MTLYNDSVLPTYLADTENSGYGVSLSLFTGGILKLKDTSESVVQWQQKQNGP